MPAAQNKKARKAKPKTSSAAAEAWLRALYADGDAKLRRHCATHNVNKPFRDPDDGSLTTPLCFAICDANVPVKRLELLLTLGADPNVLVADSQTALDVATAYGRKGMMSALKKAGGLPGKQIAQAKNQDRQRALDAMSSANVTDVACLSSALRAKDRRRVGDILKTVLFNEPANGTAILRNGFRQAWESRDIGACIKIVENAGAPIDPLELLEGRDLLVEAITADEPDLVKALLVRSQAGLAIERYLALAYDLKNLAIAKQLRDGADAGVSIDTEAILPDGSTLLSKAIVADDHLGVTDIAVADPNQIVRYEGRKQTLMELAAARNNPKVMALMRRRARGLEQIAQMRNGK